MKKYTMALTAVLMLLTLVSCQKDKEGKIMFHASLENTQSKTSFGINGDNGTISWNTGDLVKVFDLNSQSAVVSASPNADPTMADLIYVEGAENLGAECYAIYPSDFALTYNTITLPPVQASVSGELTKYPMYGHTTSEYFSFKNLCGVLELQLQGAGVAVSSIDIVATAHDAANNSVNLSGDFTIDYNSGEPVLTSGNGSNSVSLTCSTPVNIGSMQSFFIYLPPAAYTAMAIHIHTNYGREYTKELHFPEGTSNFTVNRNEFYTFPITLADNPVGTKGGAFSITGGRQVYFSQGNLQYIGSATPKYYKFADNQYDFYGRNGQNANSCTDSVNPTNCTYDCDLFGWGTGNKPWYNRNGTGYYRLYFEWGDYPILNGGNAANSGWFTLGQADWNHILFNRPASTIGTTANARHARAMVCGVVGVILFPDVYTHPSDVAVPTNINSSADGWGNSYSASDWAKMEAAGAVFLPAAGRRNGNKGENQVGYYSGYTSTNNSFDVGCYYWTSTRSSSNPASSAYEVLLVRRLTKSHIDSPNGNKHYGYAVRLVRLAN
ncbi:MAG: hypothetical protein IJM33_08470 [Bacteroidales bacterium]|nr:hypothetical protein [Bacteroidales bacterium]MBR3412369.1 hypothetical protein [Bacteroidales bacterium]